MRRLSMLVVVLGTLIACGAAQGAGWVFHKPEMIDPGTGLTGVACPAQNLCIAVDRRGDVLTSRSGAAPSRWASATIDPPGTGFTGVACASSTLCVAVDGHGSAFVSGDPSAGAAGWSSSAIDPGHALTGIACPTTSLCVATDDDASVVTSTDPMGGASAWTRSTIDNQVSQSCVKYGDEPCPPASFSGVSCPSRALCIAADDFGYAWTSVSPGAGASSWHPVGADPFAEYGGAPTSVSCPAAGLCIMVGGGEGGVISIAKDPIAQAPTDPWRPHDVSATLNWIGCPLTTLCVTDANLASFDPASGPLSFRSMAIDTRGALDGISCPSTTVCVAVDDRGHRVLATPAVAPFAGHPHVFGAARVGGTLTATSGRWRGSTPIEYTFRWQRCEPRCVAITNATSSRYRIVERDLDARLRVLVTASNVGGAARRAASALTATIRRPRPP